MVHDLLVARMRWRTLSGKCWATSAAAQRRRTPGIPQRLKDLTAKKR